MKKPNIIVMFADDLGIGDVSCFNSNSRIHTERIDRCADEGLLCTNAHATAALCTPSRYGLLTGRYNWRSRLKRGVFNDYEDNLIEDDRLTVASMLKEQGYRTACIGKWHLGMRWEKLLPNTQGGATTQVPDFEYPFRYGPVDFGFDYFYGLWASLNQGPHLYLENDRVEKLPDCMMGDYEHFSFKVTDEIKFGLEMAPAASDFDARECTPKLQRKVLELIETYAAGEEPFFIYYPTPAVHVPILPAEEFQGKSGIGPYGDFVLQTDHMVGEILDKLEELGIADDTIFLFTSDNGCASQADYPELLRQGHNPSGDYRGKKGDIWEGGHRIPYVVRYPRMIPAGISTDRMVSLSDLYRTLAELVGAEVPDTAAEDSVSNLPLWQGEDREVREDVVSSSALGSLSIQEGDWKLCLCPDSGGDAWFGRLHELPKLDPQFQLYHMGADPIEQFNLYNSEPEIAGRLKRKMADYIRNGRSTPGAPQKNTGAMHEFWNEIAWISEVET